jgi:hypothetical protein
VRNLIALCGYTGVGKDEVAKYLVENHGFVRVAFADALREDLLRLNPRVHYIEHEWWTLRDLVESEGWDKAKRSYSEVRRLLQVYGTEVGREGFGENVWVNRATEKITSHPNVVVTDLRFHNEYIRLKTLGAYVTHIIRPGHGPINDHASEKLDYRKIADYTICNDGDISKLQAEVCKVLV